MGSSSENGASFGAAGQNDFGCAEGRSNTTVGTDLGVSDETVGKWRSRFLERRLDGLSDEPRSGRPRAVTDDDVERVITLTLETAPRDATHWSTRHLQPHRTETFKLSSDPFFIEKVTDWCADVCPPAASICTSHPPAPRG